MNLKNIFKNIIKVSPSAELESKIFPSVSEATWTLGWRIIIKGDNSHTISRKYECVPDSLRDKVLTEVSETVHRMHDALEVAYKENKQFVNLEGIVIRVDDVKRIETFFDSKQHKI